MYAVAKLEQIQKGLRVRAPHAIHYTRDRVEVPAGTRGTIVDVACGGGIVFVRWDGADRAVRQTSLTSIQVL